jgi:tetratricopeptide (TPR) repeat protein
MAMDTLPKTIGRRYVLHERLGVGGMGAVYPATDRLTGEVVALKRVTTPPEQLAFASHSEQADQHLGLAREFGTLASLHHPHIISVLDYGFDEERQPFFTMDLLEDAQTIAETGQGQDLCVQTDLLVQTLQALAYLHRRGILHRDLKPENVLVAPADGRVKVLDFGVSVITPKTTEYVTQTTVGTFPYMAPELFAGAAFSRASDLYAVGVMAYELFAGRHPFDTSNPAVLLNDVLRTPADVRSIGVNDELAAVLERLLAKTSEKRYGNADQVIRDLCVATGRPLPPETIDIRESYLRAARFVGREAELGQLAGALRQAMAGRGSAWLVGGESGVGKSRLLEELRTLALVEGALVLRGQAVSEGGSPYYVWRDVLRWLALLTELSDLEAGVLKPLVPDLPDLLGRKVPDAPGLNPQAAQDRLLTVIEDLFHRQSQPTLILLEDLHWARESLVVLARLSRSVAGNRLLLVGSYRDDERPDLSTALPGMQVLKLGRLQQEAVAELSEAMLGTAGREPHVVDWLQRQTEGNPFFLVETVRALAEEMGQLADIGGATLPARIAARGVQEIVLHRLARVPQSARPLLRMAAVLGRQLDLNLLRSIEPDANLGSWLTTLADAAVLETHAGRWRFAHDRLREGVLDELAEDVRPGLHRRAAEAIEAVYPGEARRVAALAHHWVNAEDKQKAIDYLEKAGQQALQSYANEVAIAFFSQAVALNGKGGLGVDKVRRGRWELRLGEAYVNQSTYIEGREHLTEGLALLGRPVPSGKVQSVIQILGQLLQQILHRLWPKHYVGRFADRKGVLRDISRAYEKLAEAYVYANEMLLTLYTLLSMLNSAETAGPCPELARGYAAVGGMMGIIPLHRPAKAYIRRALDVAQNVKDLSTQGFTALIAGFYYAGVGDWARTEELWNTALEIFVQLGDHRSWENVVGNRAQVRYFQGRFAEGLELADTAYLSACQRNVFFFEAMALTTKAGHLIPLGRLDEAMTCLESARSLLAENEHTESIDTVQLTMCGQLLKVYLHQAEYRKVSSTAQHIKDLSTGAQVIQHSHLPGYANPAEAYLVLWEIGHQEPGIKELADKACKNLAKYARVYPIGRPRAWLWRGRYLWLSGQRAKAHRFWRKSLAAAEQLAMPYEQGLAHYEIGRHLDASNPDCAEHLQQASDIFSRLGAVPDVERAKAALDL